MPSPRFNVIACSLAFVCLASADTLVAAQIVPMPDSPVTVKTAPALQPVRTATVPFNAPAASIRGWSSGSELGPTIAQSDGKVTLDPSHPEVVIFFDAAPSVDSAPIEFRYQLDDYDMDWTVTRSRLVHYRRLTPGDHHFMVQAHIPGQPWQTLAAVLLVEQQRFFYQTWYFYVLLLLGLGALAAQLLSQREQLLKGQMGIVLEERNRIASDFHDTLMAGFAAISWQLEATAKQLREAGAQQSTAATSCELARSMVAHYQAEARRIIWDLRDSEELTNTLSQALSRAISAHKLHDSIETTLEIQGEEIPIAPGAVHHLVCIGQEAVTNAVRHAGPSLIELRLRFETDSLSLIIRDNGGGFQASDSAIRSGHFGIPVMEERARKLGGVLRLTSTPGVGTEVAVAVGFQTINRPNNEHQYVVPWIGV
jgi:signal transduction histidine kinase